MVHSSEWYVYFPTDYDVCIFLKFWFAGQLLDGYDYVERELFAASLIIRSSYQKSWIGER